MLFRLKQEGKGRVIRLMDASFTYRLYAELMAGVGMEAVVVQDSNDAPVKEYGSWFR